MSRPDSRKPTVLLATIAFATLLPLLHAGEVAAQRVGRRGGEVGGEERERRVGEEGAARGEGYEERGEGGEQRGQPSGQWQQGGEGADTYTTRRGGTVDTDKTTDGDTTTRDTTATGADGESASHTGTVTRTDDGFVARGAAVGDRGAAAGTVVKEGDQVYGRSVTTNGETVNRNGVNCENGDCNRATVTTDPAQAGVAVPYVVPYSSYPCPGGVDMVPSASGDIVYSCAVTPVVSTIVPLAGAVVAANGVAAPASTAQVTSSPVVMYQVSPDAVVYVTSYKPQGIYWKDVAGRYYWVPGPAAASQEVADDISAAAGMEQPTANATVITYTIGGDVIYLTDQAPLHGIWSQSGERLYAWIPGVTQPTDSQRAAIGTSVAVHGQQGARALADEVRRANPGAHGPS